MSGYRKTRHKSCKRKVRYTNLDLVLKAANILGQPNHPYRCRSCGGYHIGRYSLHIRKMLEQSKKVDHNTR